MSSSGLIPETLASVSKDIHKLVADIEARTRLKLERAAVEAEDARNERGEALRSLQASRSAARDYMEKCASIKSMSEQYSEKLPQQEEAILQLSQEVNAWKKLSQHWNDHFLRTEREILALKKKPAGLDASGTVAAAVAGSKIVADQQAGSSSAVSKASMLPPEKRRKIDDKLDEEGVEDSDTELYVEKRQDNVVGSSRHSFKVPQKIPKPPGTLGSRSTPERPGYLLREALEDWPAGLYTTVEAFTRHLVSEKIIDHNECFSTQINKVKEACDELVRRFPRLKQYADDWVAVSFFKMEHRRQRKAFQRKIRKSKHYA